MSLRVVLYAEGRGELGAWVEVPPAPGSTLEDQHIGPAHILIRRVMSERPTGGATEVRFEAPLRTGTGNEARGSMLFDRRILAKLLRWPRRPPDLAVVLVDEDGDDGRLTAVQGALSTCAPMCRAVPGVAAREFESWLITDLDAVRRVLGTSIDAVRRVEEMAPGDAKRLLGSWMSSAGSDRHDELRKRLAAEADLNVLRQTSRSFQRFDRDLRAFHSP